jgi:thiosulfate dehydrogenase
MEHDKVWQPPDSASIAREPDGTLIQYGRDLISHTAFYLGPRGKVKSISNGMNCQNCHLWAGTKAFGNNYSAVASTYPKFRARSGAIESMEKRVNDCLERSLNGKTLEENSVEMRAIVAYFKWVGKNVEKSFAPEGAGILDLPLLQRAADSQKGKSVFEKYCVVCHGKDAIGFKHVDSIEWRYPPLAGADSYTTAAGLFRLSRFAGYVKANMPHGTYYKNPVLTDEESWDVAAYINSLPRPVKKFAADWPDLAGKPFDHPFGPYADIFSEVQHKYGPFEPIVAAKKKKK